VSVVRRVDHVAVLVSDPQPLFDAMTQMLSLPAVWQPFEALGWSSGGVSLGNIVLEAFTPAKGHDVAVTLDRGGLATAFEPTPEALLELDRRGIRRGFPLPYQGAPPAAEREDMSNDPNVLPPWTMTMLGGFLGDRQLEQTLEQMSSAGDEAVAAVIEMSRHHESAAALVAAGTPASPWLFLCEYHDVLHARRRVAGAQALEEAGGGSLGVRGAREIVYAVEDLDEERCRWEQLLEPLNRGDDACWQFDDGPSVRLERATEAPAQRIVCEVESLDSAANSLEALGALSEHQGELVVISPSAIAGLCIWLVEGQPGG
jgi:hypothetical protein